MQVQLTNRQQHILWATVRHYIATAEPVGSKALIEEFDLGISSATIRSVMGVLEKSGLLYQPHTSAGRIPSDSGYRIYVNQLMKPSAALVKEVESTLQQRLPWDDWSLEALLQGAAQILATLSGCITLITMPQANTTQIRHLQLLQVETGKVMVIVVTDGYETHSKVVDLFPESGVNQLEAETIDRELQILSNFLNTSLRNYTLSDLANMNWSELDREFQSYGELLKKSLTELLKRASNPPNSQIMVRGVGEVLRQPEFSQVQQVQTIMHLLEEEQEQLWKLICDEPEIEETGQPKVTVRIGTENPLEPMRTCSLIFSSYRRGTVPVGRVGVLGPTRLDYENAIAVVAAAAAYLSEAFNYY
ncbi:heat-inducible transcriptional repressor HrcA [Cylindrospermopsis raciborskii S07]|jgi:heat-inducible transcriptional repressor|uniref:Heat-inducible transcription repressor HrcA n=2 Tax=Cylindrospermopsis raciborskii TaxID=77022 RepID=A0A853MHB5_9CYAN|nr:MULTISPECIES: heat-inducible transcriptional repressor HrcA [Cylindrospermopsis]MBU6343926.1 heat-inducible transcriptional repressor HrcA [Cyanobacteria bacterium REEB494]EFA71447.1 Negative regulator of class I heat shock protein [Cylindrospermopsis raciborskii CS-505]KRH97084.1 HrcA family transcriptional regulator [Cylindrospermopsis sp. CR12]OBU76864.1 heat-inducible transcriptional repressor HrcA [Cylindrospermopsis raciborskii CS-505]OHY38783.1 heat-inducible transcriptional represso